MSRFYVISPNVENKSNTLFYIDEMFKTHTTMIGWAPDTPKGQMFDRMEIGDYVLCAQGPNKNKKVFFAGKVASENSKEWPFKRELVGFVDLRNETIEFSSDNAYGAASQIPAIYELKQQNDADNAICKQIQALVDDLIAHENR